MELPFGVSAYARTRGNISELPVVNMMAEASPVDGRVVLQSRTGLVLEVSAGSGPVTGLFRRDGILSGSLCAVSGGQLYIGASLAGAITGNGPVSMAGDEEELTVCAGGPVFQTTGGSVSPMAFPGGYFTGGAFIKTIDLAGYNIAIEKDSARYWFRLWGSPWDDLGFITAENEPDRLLDAVAVDDYLVLFGSETVEFHVKTGQLDAPFEPITARVFEKGIRGVGCAANFDNTAAWVTSKRQGSLVCKAGNVPEVISDDGISERIEGSESLSVDSFFYGRHEFLRILGDDFCILYDASTGEWSEWESYGRVRFRGQCSVAGPLFGDDETGAVWALGTGFTDNDGVLERRFRAGAVLDQPVGGNAVRLTANPGQTASLTGTYADPVIEMRSSRDAGQTWGNWNATALGAQGQYRQRIEWRRLGLFDDPGMLFEFRLTDPVPLAVRSVQFNPPKGGRSR